MFYVIMTPLKVKVFLRRYRWGIAGTDTDRYLGSDKNT